MNRARPGLGRVCIIRGARYSWGFDGRPARSPWDSAEEIRAKSFSRTGIDGASVVAPERPDTVTSFRELR